MPKNDFALLSVNESRVLRALHRYGLSQERWEQMPEISPIIWKHMGSQENAVKLLRFSSQPRVIQFLKVFFALSKDDQEHLPLEITCFAAGVEPQYILRQLISCAKEAAAVETAITLISSQTNVLKATANFAMSNSDNVKDREMILKATGVIPSAQGSSVNVNFFSKNQDHDEDRPAPESQLEQDVLGYDASEVEGWGDARRDLLDKGE